MSSRHELHAKLRELLGDERADVLMEHLPPVGWADVATKHDLAALEDRLSAKLSDLRADFQAEFHAQTKTFVTWLIAGMGASSLAVAGLAIAAIQLT